MYGCIRCCGQDVIDFYRTTSLANYRKTHRDAQTVTRAVKPHIFLRLHVQIQNTSLTTYQVYTGNYKPSIVNQTVWLPPSSTLLDYSLTMAAPLHKPTCFSHHDLVQPDWCAPSWARTTRRKELQQFPINRNFNSTRKTPNIPHHPLPVKLMFLYSTVSTLNPMVGIVVTTSPSLSLYRIVVLPAASRPTCHCFVTKHHPIKASKKIVNVSADN